jgi:hypothetical protein
MSPHRNTTWFRERQNAAACPPRAFSDPMESENVSRFLLYHIFFTRTGAPSLENTLAVLSNRIAQGADIGRDPATFMTADIWRVRSMA